MGVSENSGTPKSSILIGFSIIFTIQFGVSKFLETPIYFSGMIFGSTKKNSQRVRINPTVEEVRLIVDLISAISTSPPWIGLQKL